MAVRERGCGLVLNQSSPTTQLSHFLLGPDWVSSALMSALFLGRLDHLWLPLVWLVWLGGWKMALPLIDLRSTALNSIPAPHSQCFLLQHWWVPELRPIQSNLTPVYSSLLYSSGSLWLLRSVSFFVMQEAGSSEKALKTYSILPGHCLIAER